MKKFEKEEGNTEGRKGDQTWFVDAHEFVE
jgi:hypothetical protein